MKLKNLLKFRNGTVLLIIISFALFLRLMGLNWGLQNNHIVRWSTHYDEFFSFECCKQVNLSKWDINPESGQIDGSFAYYLWNFNAFVLKSVGLLNKTPIQIDTIDQDYSNFILVSRFLIVIFDLLSVFLIYLIVQKITGNNKAALISSFVFAIVPFEIMHSNYMRPHVLLNTFLLLIIYLSLFIYENKKNILYVKIGLVLGFCTATRYTCIIYAVIPGLFFYIDKFSSLKKKSLKNIILILINRKLIIMLLFLLCGLIIGNPSWLLDFESIKNGIFYQSNNGRKIDGDLIYFIKTFKYYFTHYVIWIVPAGTFILWLLFYPALIYSFLLKKYFKYIIPLFAFSVIYFVPMMLYYPIETIRTTLPLFPVFSIILGIVLNHLFNNYGARKIIFYPFLCFLGFVLISSSVFSFSLARSMGDESKDAYIQAATYFQDKTEKKQLNIALIAGGSDIYILPNIYYALNSVLDKKFNFYDGDYEKYILHKNYDGHINYNKIKNDSIDYIMICNIDYEGIEPTREIINYLTKNNDFIFEKEFKKDICFYGLSYDYSYAPHDFRYPFQTFHLLKANKTLSWQRSAP